MLLTRAEQTRYRETSLHADVMRFVSALAEAHPRYVHTSTFGVSPGGREMPLLVVSGRGIRTPEQARASGLPVVLMMDGIHPGEVEGKEATLALLRDLLGGSPDRGLLDEIVLVVVPLFNPDGNDALDPKNRRLDLPKLQGQIGPVVGTRTNSEGINLNRDYLRMASREMRALQSRVAQPWAADLTVDNHATNGSVHRFHMTVDVPHTVDSGHRASIELARDRLVPDVIAAVAKRGFRSGWYGNFVEDERALDAGADVDPKSAVGEGWMTYPHHPRFGANYRGLLGRPDLLLECYSYLTFDERVHTAYAWQIEILRWAAAHQDLLVQTARAHSAPPARVAVRYELRAEDKPVEVLTRSPRTLSGAESSVSLRHFAKFVGTTVIERPLGYIVPRHVAEHLQLHGLSASPLPAGEREVEIATVTSAGAEAGRKILEAGSVGEIAVRWDRKTCAIPADRWLVTTEQPAGAVAVYLCEPESDDGAVENGLVTLPALGGEFPLWRALS